LATLQEKLDRETGQKIFLYKQGVFWTAYEQSALILSRHKQWCTKVKTCEKQGMQK
jgi:hypothetical protein